MSKLIEKYIKVQMIMFLYKYNIINGKQFGFQENKFDFDTVLDFPEFIHYYLDKESKCSEIFVDLVKVFDSVNREYIRRNKFEVGI